ncbi:queuine tRNA-ribosyltransferase accessory subunit 2 [Aricia agestis]|uniref:queuine tRNA-ribosyltransferase accessory subunit 2 n=1 Tax=Aricia agestis TaxID=91739 RepID=UPI001C20C370|nr:queuine tRNA-ribosyltransferase accessory subunit 2 [Aricia agestis]
MRFIIKHTGRGGERVGTLSGFLKSPNAVIETPTAALETKGGSVIHITAEVLAKIFTAPQLLWLPLSNSIQLETGCKLQNEGVAKFAGLPEHVTLASLQNVSEETSEGHFEGDKVPLWTRQGKVMISASRYMDVMEVFKPDIILAIADGHTSLEEPNKRIAKSVARTSNMFEVCVDRYKASTQLKDSSLIGVVVGAANLKKCEESLQSVLKHADVIQGVALEGVTDGKGKTMDIDYDDLKEIFEKIGNAIPKHLLRIFEGAWNPALVVSAIEQGWDVFDGSYPVSLTCAGYALCLTYDMNKEKTPSYLLDLSDESYAEDFTPIAKGCECLCCQKHTRAYIRHLINTREMLASVLLSIHNLYHFDQLFHHARRHIENGTFQDFKNYIIEQCKNCTASLYKFKPTHDNKENIRDPKKLRT